jgi:7-carboxy-7-deazaguanine synthase
MDAHLVEIFESVQGEGPQVGQLTVFVRFAECDLRCSWCDTPDSWRRVPTCRVHGELGRGEPEIIENPVALERLLAWLDERGVPAGRWVSFTGGEPLLQPDALKVWAAAMRERGLRVHLETHGLAADALAAVIAEVEFVSMDWKLASDVRRVSDRGSDVADFNDAHSRFLEAIGDRADACVKIVVTPSTRREELEEACRRMAATRPATPLILQPVTPCGGVKTAPDLDSLMDHVTACARILEDVRLIPQTHKSYGAL